jgi:tetratricopeptide (TPR) repeat protein
MVRQKKTLLILDGMEPLQYPPGEMQGCLKDQALQALLKELSRSQAGLCVVTTRVKVEDIEHAVDRTVNCICLEHLSPEVGAELLKKLEVKGTEAELKKASEEFKGHALALNLLGRYLAVVHDGDIRKKDLIPRLTEEEKEGSHARRVMKSYEKFLFGKPELNILYIIGLFDRPAEREAINGVIAKPWIKGLTKKLKKLSEANLQYALQHLRDLNLLAEKEEHCPDMLACHPLVREYFGERLRKINSEAWREAHNRLYEYYKNQTIKEFPYTLKEMEPLYLAVSHGCLAVRHKEALDEIYKIRILRGYNYSWKTFGSSGSDLAALSGFFTRPWQQLVNGISENDKGFIMNAVGVHLRALGRLREAAQPMKVGLEVAIKQRHWRDAAQGASNLSELYLSLGEVTKSVEAARQSVDLVDLSGQVLWQSSYRTTLADALHQAGEMTEAESLFQKAEGMQKKEEPEYSFLYTIHGYRYCDLMLGLRQYREVQKRAEQTLKLAKKVRFLLDIGLDNLSLGRSHLLQAIDEGAKDFTKPLDYLDRAVDGLREAGQQDYLSRGLLARAAVFRTMKEFPKAWEDLNEVLEIAERGGMNLYLADYHLEAARLCLAEGKKKEAAEHLATAREMINKMGYHRRDKDVEEIEGQLAVDSWQKRKRGS